MRMQWFHQPAKPNQMAVWIPAERFWTAFPEMWNQHLGWQNLLLFFSILTVGIDVSSALGI